MVSTGSQTSHVVQKRKNVKRNDEKVINAVAEFKKSFLKASEGSTTGGIKIEDYNKFSMEKKMAKMDEITNGANGTMYKLYLAGKVWLDAHEEGKKLGDKLNEAHRFDKKHCCQTAVAMKNNFNKTEEKAYNAYKHNIHEKFKLCTIFVFFIGF